MILSGCDASVNTLHSLDPAQATKPTMPEVADAPQEPMPPVMVSEPVSVIQPSAVLPEIPVEENRLPENAVDSNPPITGSIEATESIPAAQIIQSSPLITIEPTVKAETPEELTQAREPASQLEVLTVEDQSQHPSAETQSSVSTENPPVASVDLPSRNSEPIEVAQASEPPQPAQQEPPQEAQQIVPPTIAAAVASIPVKASQEDDSSDDLEVSEDSNSNEVTDIKLEGSCYKKKRTAIFWYHKKFPERKKSISWVCKNGTYKGTIKVKNKYLPMIMIQTAFFD